MCTQVFGEGFDTPTGSIDCVADFRRNGFVVLPDDVEPYPDVTDNDCLCSVDVEAILDRSGRPYEWDPFGYKVTA